MYLKKNLETKKIKRRWGKMFKTRGQSTLEYVIILTAIIAAVIFGVTHFTTHDTGSGLGKLMNDATDRITDATGRLPH